MTSIKGFLISFFIITDFLLSSFNTSASTTPQTDNIDYIPLVLFPVPMENTKPSGYYPLKLSFSYEESDRFLLLRFKDPSGQEKEPVCHAIDRIKVDWLATVQTVSMCVLTQQRNQLAGDFAVIFQNELLTLLNIKSNPLNVFLTNQLEASSFESSDLPQAHSVVGRTLNLTKDRNNQHDFARSLILPILPP